MSQEARWVVRVLVAATLAGGTVLSTAGLATRADAAPQVIHPIGGSFALTGHGSGHGHGLSQWGAYGAATRGLNAAAILDFYYPGTASADRGSQTVRVKISGDEGVDVFVAPSARTGALSVVDHGAGARRAVLPAAVGAAPVTGWRAVWAGAGRTALQGWWAGGWRNFPAAGGWVTGGSLEFAAATGRITLVYPDRSQRDYAGALSAVPAATGVLTVNTVPVEAYLRSVVPSESPASWPAAALQAQAVAARTYAAAVGKPAGPYDLCDWAACQVYPGLAAYSAAGTPLRSYLASGTDAAVAATAGMIRTFRGAPIFAQFGSADGGWTTAGDGGEPYLPARADPYDGIVPNTANTWSQGVTAAAVGAAFGVGTATALRIDARDGRGEWGGRISGLTVFGSSGSVSLSGTAFADQLGLRSSWWTALPGDASASWQNGLVDLAAITTAGGSGRVELHTLTRSSNYQEYLRHVATALGAVEPSDWRFAVGPYGGDGAADLFAVRIRGSGTGRVEVHVLSAASGYQDFAAHIVTAQHSFGDEGVDLAVGAVGGDGAPDLTLVQWSDTGSGQVEVHTLSAASGYQRYLVHAASALPERQVAAGQWAFILGDRVGGAGSGDLYAIHYAGITGSGQTEVHVLSRGTGYRTWSLHTATALRLLPAGSAAFLLQEAVGSPAADLVAVVHGAGSGSGRTEVHTLRGASGFATFSLHVATALSNWTGAGWQFSAS